MSVEAAQRTRARFAEATEATAIGARLARKSRQWVIGKSRMQYCSVALTLRHGRRSLRVVVPVCITGPCWFDVDLRPAGAAPVQRSLLGAQA